MLQASNTKVPRLINTEEQEPKRSSTALALQALAKTTGHGIVHSVNTIVTSEATAYICANATYALLMTIFSGFPSIVPELAREFAKYQIPLVAIPVVLITALRIIKFKGTEIPHRLVMSVMNGLGLATFTIPMMMELVTRAVQIIEDESRDTAVWIPDWSAYIIIGGCTMVGLLQAIQTYYQQVNDSIPNKQRSSLNKVTTNKLMLVVFSMLNSASAFHAATFQAMKVAGLNTADLVEYYTRLGITGAAALSGGYFLGIAEPKTRKDVRAFNMLTNLMKLSALGIANVDMFYLSPNAEKTYGQEIIDEQTMLWLLIMPLIPSIILLLQLAGLQGPKLLKAIGKVMNEIIHCCKEGRFDEIRPLFANGDTSINSDRVVVINDEDEDEDEAETNSFDV